MRRLAALIAMAVIAAALYPSSNRAAAEADMSGDWALTLTYEGAPGPLDCLAVFLQKGASLSVPFVCHPSSGASTLYGSFNEATMRFSLLGDYVGPGVFDIAFTGTLSDDADSVEGSFNTSVMISGEFVGQRSPSRWGDIDCTAEVDSKDALLVLQHAASLLPYPPCKGFGDVNIDASVDTDDALLILQREVGLLERLPVLPDA